MNRAWTWIKQDRIGDGPEGQNAFPMGAAKRAEAAWDWIKAKDRAVQKTTNDHRRRWAACPAGITGADQCSSSRHVVGVVKGVRWSKANWGKGTRYGVRRALISKKPDPFALSRGGGGTVNRMPPRVTKAGGMLNSKPGLSAGMARMVGRWAESVLSFDGRRRAMDRGPNDTSASGGARTPGLSRLGSNRLTRLAAFLQPAWIFSAKVAGLIVDIYGTAAAMRAGKLGRRFPS